MCLAVSHVKETEATARPIWTGLKKEFMKSTRFHEKPLARNGNPYVLFCYVFVVVVVFSLTLTNANAKHYKLVCCAVVDPGIPMDSAGLIDCQFPTWPRFQKIVCRNERIRMLGGAHQWYPCIRQYCEQQLANTCDSNSTVCLMLGIIPTVGSKNGGNVLSRTNI